MSDLISRSEVNDVIDELEVYTIGRPNTTKVEISVLQLQRFINKLKNIPTAYDVDKVVKEINEWAFNANIDVGNGTVMNHNLIVRNTAIEIVKTGGTVNE